MMPELLAGLRGILVNVVNAFSNPLLGLWILIGIYLFWRRTYRA